MIDGHKLISFASNDYLGLAHDDRILHAFQLAAREQVGAMSSAMVCGRSTSCAQLESELAKFEGTESCLLFPSGFAANFGVVTTLAERTDAVFCDRDNHASIIDAVRTCDARMLIYRRDRLDRMQTALEKRRHLYDQVFIVTDGVFSMDGTVAPLQQICSMAERFQATVVVDEAHGTGVLGPGGRGASEYCGVESAVFLRVGTLSKALGGLGGFVVGDGQTISWLRNRARSQFFSTALPPALCVAAGHAVQTVISEPQRRQHLAALTRFCMQRAAEHGLQLAGTPVAPIVGILIGDEQAAVDASRRLQESGWLVPAIRPPTVRPGTSRLRVSLSHSHTETQVAEMLQTAAQVVLR